MKQNFLAIWVGLLLSFVVYWGISQYSTLTADIRGVVTAPTISADAIMSVTEQWLDIVLNKNIPGVESISMLLFYDTDTVKWTDDTVSSTYSYTASNAEPGEVSLVFPLNQAKTLKKNEKITTLIVNGNPYDMIVSDITVTFSDGSVEPLSLMMP